MSCQDVRVRLGGHVLDGLTPAEHAEVDAHLRACPACRAEFEQLADLPPLLDLVADAPPRPPETLRERVLATTVRRQVRRRRLVALVAALAVGLVVGGAAATVLRLPGSTVTTVTVALEPGDGYDVTGEAAFVDTRAGVQVDLLLDALPPLPKEAVYEAWLGAPAVEEPVSIGRFHPQPDGSARVLLAAEGALDDYSSIWVTAEPDVTEFGHDGPTVVAAPLPGHEQPPGGR